MNARVAYLHGPSIVLVAWAALVLIGVEGTALTVAGLVATALAAARAELERQIVRAELREEQGA